MQQVGPQRRQRVATWVELVDVGERGGQPALAGYVLRDCDVTVRVGRDSGKVDVDACLMRLRAPARVSPDLHVVQTFQHAAFILLRYSISLAILSDIFWQANGSRSTALLGRMPSTRCRPRASHAAATGALDDVWFGKVCRLTLV